MNSELQKIARINKMRLSKNHLLTTISNKPALEDKETSVVDFGILTGHPVYLFEDDSEDNSYEKEFLGQLSNNSNNTNEE